MNANQHGTVPQQVRHEARWMDPETAAQSGVSRAQRCITCAHLDLEGDGPCDGRAACDLLRVGTALGSTCAYWRPMPRNWER